MTAPTDLLIAVLVSLAIGFLLGYGVRGYLSNAQKDLLNSDRDLDRAPHVQHDAHPLKLCPRCGRWNGTHTTACERARIDILVAPVRRRESGARGQDGLSDRFQSAAWKNRGDQ